MDLRYEVWERLSLATMVDPRGGCGEIVDGAIVVQDGVIRWVGERKELPALKFAKRHNLKQRWMTPGLIDCHTHLVFAGDRSDEFERRLAGESYAEIARSGGGIKSTVSKTRQASEESLVASAAARLRTLMASGVTTLEIKSGYGLDIESELKMLRAARRLERIAPVSVRTSFLGAHALPDEFIDRRSDYVQLVTGPMLDAIVAEGLADYVDAFAETIAFSTEEVSKVFSAALRHRLPVRLHADQLTDQGGAALASRFAALSADHLEFTSEAGVAEMARTNVVAVLLPCAQYFLGEQKKPPVGLFRKHRVPMAVATDCNPGSSPCASLLLALNMACTQFGLTPTEALVGATRNAALALGLSDRGSLAAEQIADFAVWDIDRPSELSYWMGGQPLYCTVKSGKRAFQALKTPH